MPRGIYTRTPETRAVLSNAHLGKKATTETRKKMSASHKGQRNSWKGDDVGYSGLHMWVRKHLGRPTTCEHCGRTGLTRHQIHWANKSHKYKRSLDDWLRLCQKCHYVYDEKGTK